MYLFGGINEHNSPTDDLYWISCDFKANQKAIDPQTGDYKGPNTPELRLIARRV